MKRKLSILVVLCLVLTSLASFALADTVTGVIKTPASDGSVNIRSQGSAKYPVIGWAKNGTKVEILYQGNYWHKVKVISSGKTGWVSARYVKIGGSSSSGSDNSGVSGTVASVTTRYSGSVVNLRAGAGTEYASVGGVSRGTRLSVLASVGNWYQVYVPSKGITAYISKTYATLGLNAATTGDVNMRTGAGTDHSRICVIPKGTKISVLSVGNSWSEVSYNGKSGYISNRYWKYR